MEPSYETNLPTKTSQNGSTPDLLRYASQHDLQEEEVKGVPKPVEATTTSAIYDLDEVDLWLDQQRLNFSGAKL